MTRKLKVFLCHASEDKPAVYELYNRLVAESWIDPWLDKENLLPGQDWNLEINKATREADVIIICMSKVSVEKEGFLNKEIRRVLDISNEKLEGAIYIIPLRLDECNPSFERLKQIHYADYFTPNAHERLLKSLRIRANDLKIEIVEKRVKRTSKPESKSESKPSAKGDQTIIRYALPWTPSVISTVDLDLYRFIQIPLTEEVSYSYYIGKYPVTNAQYERFLSAPDFANPVYWLEFPGFDENCKQIGDWGREGLDWLKDQVKESKSKVLLPRYWDHNEIGKTNPNHPVVGISWYEASAYCEWLFQNWVALSESKANPSLQPRGIRLPLETEWVSASGGDKSKERYPWDESGKETKSLKEILRRANIKESGIERTTPVNAYPLGQSPFGVMDMAGNVWEWQVNYSDQNKERLGLRGGSWSNNKELSCASFRSFNVANKRSSLVGFRVVLLPSG